MAKWSSATQTEDIALLIEKKIKIALYGASKSSELPRWRTKTKLSSRSSDCDGPSKQLFHRPWRKMKVNLVRQYMCVVCVCAATCLPHGLWVLCWMVRYGKYWLWCGWMPSPPQRKSERWRLMQFRKIWTCEEACVNDADLIMFAFIYQFMPVCDFINRFS